MLGAMAKVLGNISIDSVVKAIKTNWSGKLGEINAVAAERAFKSVRKIT